MTEQAQKPYDIVVQQGTTKRISFVWQDVDDSTNPPTKTPRNLVGWTAKGQIRQRRDENSPLMAVFSFTIDTTTGRVNALLTAAESQKVTQDGAYDIELTNANGTEVVRVLSGKVTVDKGVTK